MPSHVAVLGTDLEHRNTHFNFKGREGGSGVSFFRPKPLSAKNSEPGTYELTYTTGRYSVQWHFKELQRVKRE